MTFRVCTFNAAGRRGGKEFLERRVQPDAVLLQEAKAELWPGAFMPISQTEGRARLGATAVFSPSAAIEPLRPKEDPLLGASSPTGTLTAAVIKPRDAPPLVVASGYALIQNNLAFPTAESLVEDIEPLLAANGGSRFIFGGDFNAWDQYGGVWQRRWQSLWTRLEGIGLVNLLRHTRASRPRSEWCGCGLGDGCWHVQTVRRTSRALTDYLWVTADLVENCAVGVMDIEDGELRGISDHAPVWADLAF